jgi:carbon monoxide dehydrogenase subunit G
MSIAFQTSVHVARPIEEVFAFVSDPTRFPSWNSAVTSVAADSSRAGELSSTYAMRRELPSGRAENGLVIFELAAPTAFGIRTTDGPTPFTYRYRLVATGAATVIELDAEVELPGLAELVAPLAGRAIKRGVDANLATLKQLLERRG